eukprot:7220984-Alexandrium_andersonii.AAC.1
MVRIGLTRAARGRARGPRRNVGVCVGRPTARLFARLAVGCLGPPCPCALSAGVGASAAYI